MTIRPFDTTCVFDWNYNAKCPVVINQGGTSGSKTYSILQVLAIKAIQEKGIVTTVVSQDIPNLKSGAIRDMDSIIGSSEFLQKTIRSINRSEHIYTFKNGSVIEFKSYDNEQDAKSGKRDYLFMNEADGIEYQVAEQLMLKTRRQSFIDYNPTLEFWAQKEYVKNPLRQMGVDYDFFISNYRHNLGHLTDKQIKGIEDLKFTSPELWKVYGLGKTGMLKGQIFQNCFVLDKWPEETEKEIYGLDFGFTNDPTCLMRRTFSDGNLCLDELIYETGMTNKDIDQRMNELELKKSIVIYADSADPKSIKELRTYGWNVKEAIKGQDSVLFGIQFLKKYKLFITKRSVNAWKEQRSYIWLVDKKTGDPTNKPIDKFNHFWDATRYSCSELITPKGMNVGWI